MLQYQIAGLTLNISSDSAAIIESLAEFLTPGMGSGHLNITLQASDFIKLPEGKLIIDEQFQWLGKPNANDGYFVYYPIGPNCNEVLILADVDSQWKNANITYRNNMGRSTEDNYKESTEFYTRMLMDAVFRYCLVYHEGLVLHSSTINGEKRVLLLRHHRERENRPM